MRTLPDNLKKIDDDIWELDGVQFRALGRRVEPGDSYIAFRNGPAQLLTCAKVVDYVMDLLGWKINAPWVEPVERAYSFDPSECLAVELI
jgi:hypothetical protein